MDAPFFWITFALGAWLGFVAGCIVARLNYRAVIKECGEILARTKADYEAAQEREQGRVRTVACLARLAAGGMSAAERLRIEAELKRADEACGEKE